MKREHLFSLDFVRVLAAVMIVIFHYNAVTLMIPEVNKPILLFVHYANGSMGHIGVSLFFILAGASLMYSSMEKLDLKQYFKKRFLAIFPIYWTVYSAFFVYNYLIKRVFTFDKPLWRLPDSQLLSFGRMVYRLYSPDLPDVSFPSQMYAQMAGAYPCGSRYDLCSAHAVLSVSDGYPVLFPSQGAGSAVRDVFYKIFVWNETAEGKI